MGTNLLAGEVQQQAIIRFGLEKCLVIMENGKMDSQVWCVYTMVDSADQARQIAREAVEGRRAACVQIESGITSVFRWKDSLEATSETRLVFKLSSAGKESLISWLKDRHPYEVPEILAWPVVETDPDYGQWVREES